MTIRTWDESELGLWESKLAQLQKGASWYLTFKVEVSSGMGKIKPKAPEMRFCFLCNFIHDVYIFSLILLSEENFSARSSITNFLSGLEVQKYSSLIQSIWLDLENYLNETNIIVFCSLHIFINDKEKHRHSETGKSILG